MTYGTSPFMGANIRKNPETNKQLSNFSVISSQNVWTTAPFMDKPREHPPILVQ